MPDIYEVEHNGEIWEVEANSPEEAAATFDERPAWAPPDKLGTQDSGSVPGIIAQRNSPLSGYDESDVMGQPIMPNPTGLAKTLLKRAGPGIVKIGAAIEQPVVSGAIGGAQRLASGGSVGEAVRDAGIYAIGGTVLGKVMGKIGARLTATNPNAGGRLVPRSTPNVTESLDDALNAMRGPQPTTMIKTPGIISPAPSRSVQSVSLPTQPPGPSVTLSPKSRIAASGRTPPPKGGRAGDLGSGAERMYQELARKPILTPEEQQIFDRLHAVMGKQASNIGRSYAARGGQ